MLLRGNVFSQVLEMTTGITVLTPNQLKAGGKYKVAYLLHGLCGNSANWVDNSLLPVYAMDYDVIFVMPEVARSFYTDMNYGLKYLTYITDELPQICQSIFNISAQREDTAIIGGSMGGYGALKAALSRPEQYGMCGAFASPCLFLKENLDRQREDEKACQAIYGEQLIRDFKAIFGEQLACNPEDEILELAQKANGQHVKPRIYTSCGTEDFFRAENRRFSEAMKKLDFDLVYEEWPGKHDFYFFDTALRQALQKFFDPIR